MLATETGRGDGAPMIGRLTFIALLFLSWAQSMHAEPEYPAMGPDIFDQQAAGETLVDQALGRAQKEGKRVLVFFGANWCPWCRRLHRLFEQAPAMEARLQKEFIVVYVDANFRRNRNRNATVLKRYGEPVKQYGLPVLVVLAPDGSQLTTQESNSLAAPTDEQTVKLIAEFLAKWSAGAKPR